MRRKLVSKMNLQNPISIYLNIAPQSGLMGLETVSVKCIQCPEEKQSLQELKAHISLDHLTYLPYQCAICASVFRPTDETLKLHVQETHPGQQPKMLYTPDEAKEARLNCLISQSYQAKAAEEGLNVALGHAASGNNSPNLPLNNPPLSSTPSSESAIIGISELPGIIDFYDEEELSINDDNHGDTQKISDSRIRRTRSENAAQKEMATSFSPEDPPPASERRSEQTSWSNDNVQTQRRLSPVSHDVSHELLVVKPSKTRGPFRGSNPREKDPQKNKKSKFEPLTIELPTLGEQAATNEIMSTHMTAYMCDICGKRFSTKRKLLRHRQELHTSEHQKWRCQICGRKFAYRDNYISHLKSPNVHFPCAECREKCFSARALRDHVQEQHIMSTHMTAYMCDICGKRFSTKRKLLRHRRESHASEHRKWRCRICGRKFARRDNYLAHLKSPSVHFPCAECGEKSFSSARTLRDHVREQHGSASSLINVVISQSGNEVVTPLHRATFSAPAMIRSIRDVTIRLDPIIPEDHYCQLCEPDFKRPVITSPKWTPGQKYEHVLSHLRDDIDGLLKKDVSACSDLFKRCFPVGDSLVGADGKCHQDLLKPETEMAPTKKLPKKSAHMAATANHSRLVHPNCKKDIMSERPEHEQEIIERRQKCFPNTASDVKTPDGNLKKAARIAEADPLTDGPSSSNSRWKWQFNKFYKVAKLKMAEKESLSPKKVAKHKLKMRSRCTWCPPERARKELFHTQSLRQQHVMLKHYKKKVYGCELCAFRDCHRKMNVRVHIRQCHPKQKVGIIDWFPHHKPEIEKMIIDCFGKKRKSLKNSALTVSSEC